MSTNQFDFAQQFMNPENFMKGMKGMPTIDFSSFSNMLKNNADAITEANKMASESMQSILKRGSESLQQNATEMFNSMKEAVAAGDMEQMAHCQQKYLKSTLENNLDNTKEMLDMTSKSAMEILDVVGKNMTENMNKVYAKSKKQG
jgi:phasin family protein